jgi:lipopolysaccharide/colanic/teichoic acid biosynthesis glycosyltransferase
MRVLDLSASAAGLFLLFPLFLILAVLVKLDSPGPVFYRARRAGQFGRPFTLYKFRSMRADADQTGPAITTANDRRITKMGYFLRRTKLDELPQLINVLKGEMSLVGPRPEDMSYIEFYTAEQSKILNIRPGITSMASLQYRDEASELVGAEWEKMYITEIMPAKLAIDLDYMTRRTLWSDIVLIAKTIVTIGR